MTINITSLFQDILESPEQKQQRQMMEGFKRRDNAVSGLTGLAQVAAPLVGTMAELQPQRNEMLQKGVGRLLGRDVRSTSEKVSDALKGFNPQDPQSVSQTTQMLQQLGLGPQAAQLSSMALDEQKQAKMTDLQIEGAQQTIDMNKTAAQVTATARQAIIDNRPRLQTIVDESSLPTSKKNAVKTAIGTGAYDQNPEKLIEMAFPDDKDRYKAVGKAIFDSANGRFITAPAGTATPEDFMSTVDPDQYDPASVTEFLRAQYTARTPDEQAQAYTTLRPKAEQGYSWTQGYDEENNEIAVQRPVPGSAPYTELQKEVSAANNSANNVIRNSSNSVEVIDNIINALENNEVETGVKGIVLSYFPETGEADLGANLETIKSNLGIGELESMRAASANGASGFGQLTEKELNLLLTRVRNVSQRQSREQQVENLKEIRDQFASMANKAKTDWTMDEWVGIARRPGQPSEASIATPNGSFTIVPR